MSINHVGTNEMKKLHLRFQNYKKNTSKFDQNF